MAAWLLRTFKNRSLGFMGFLYRMYILPLTDYCSHLYSPTKFNEIESLEAIPTTQSLDQTLPPDQGEAYLGLLEIAWYHLNTEKIRTIQNILMFENPGGTSSTTR